MQIALPCPTDRRSNRRAAPTTALTMAAMIALAAAGTCSAQAPAAASPVPVFGPPLAGACLFAKDAALGGSEAGLALSRRLEQLRQQVQANVNQDRDAVAAADQTLNSLKPRLPVAEFRRRALAQQQRAEAFNSLVQARNLQLRQTQATALGQIVSVLNSRLADAITAHHCSLVFERSSLYGANPAMDITQDVVTRMNAALPTLSVTLAPATAP